MLVDGQASGQFHRLPAVRLQQRDLGQQDLGRLHQRLGHGRQHGREQLHRDQLGAAPPPSPTPTTAWTSSTRRRATPSAGPPSAARNVISGNANEGVLIGLGATKNLVEGNYIGTDYTGTKSVPNALDGVYVGLGAVNNTIGTASRQPPPTPSTT